MCVLIGLSGGVDSSVAAWALQSQGRDVAGCALTLFSGPAAERTTQDARLVCERLGIPFHELDARDLFERRVVEPFCAEYGRGRTPNPCVLCNPRVKLELLIRHADRIGARSVATGHYARVEGPGDSGRFRLLRGADSAKEQSYFLYGLSQRQLARIVLPLGPRHKTWTRARADEMDLPSRLRPESQDVCFIPDNDYARFLEARSPDAGRPGNIVDGDGRILGRHNGIHRFTIGRRRGLGVAAGEPRYVVRIDPASGDVVIGPRQALLSPGLVARRVNWVSIPAPEAPIRAQVRIRGAHQPAPASVAPLDAETVRVRFDEPQSAVTPGQAAVFYDEDVLLGGGTIAEASALSVE